MSDSVTSEVAEARRVCSRGWCKRLETALQSDGWGQVIEATEVYDELGHSILTVLDSLDPAASDRAFVNKTLVCVNLRSKVLSTSAEGEGPTVDQMALVLPALKLLFKGPTPVFPIDLKEFSSSGVDWRSAVKPKPRRGGAGAEASDDEGEAAAGGAGPSRGGTLQPCPRLISGMHYLSVDIESIGLKDAPSYIDPYFTISVFDPLGREMGVAQDTPKSNRHADSHVLFGSRVFVQTPLAELREANAAVFFEFKHWKPREKYVSVRCWSLLEMDEVKEGACLLEIYKKPMDPRRKKIKTHSVKPLYLHVRLSLHSL